MKLFFISLCCLKYLNNLGVFFSSVAHPRREPGEGWGWTSPCSAVSTSWPRSWFLWRWDLWPHWWAGLREWCILRAWCHSWVACTPLSAWCTSCPPLRVSPPKARPSHYWRTCNQTPLHSVYLTRTPSHAHSLTVLRCLSAFHSSDSDRHTAHSAAHCNSTVSHALRWSAPQTDRQTLATTLPGVNMTHVFIQCVCPHIRFINFSKLNVWPFWVHGPLKTYWNSEGLLLRFGPTKNRLGSKSRQGLSVFNI